MAKQNQSSQKKPGTGLMLVGKNEERIRGQMAKLSKYMGNFLPDQGWERKLMDLGFLLVRRTPLIQQCTEPSFYAALLQAAKFALQPDVRGQCWFIPRKTGPKNEYGEKAYEVSFQIGYQGLLELARRSGAIGKVEARVVRAKDQFDYEFGTTPYIKHKPARGGDVGKLTAVYAIGWLANGLNQFVVLEEADVLRYKNMAQGLDKASSPWKTWEPEMWQKTALARLCRFLPASIELAEAAAMSEKEALDERQQLEHTNDIAQQLGQSENEDDSDVLDVTSTDSLLSEDDLMPSTQIHGDEMPAAATVAGGNGGA